MNDLTETESLDRLSCIWTVSEERHINNSEIHQMKARFYVDVEFDGSKTDAESIATALDKVTSNGLAVLLDCWEPYGGEPQVGEFFVLHTETARQHADDLDSLIDGREDDELGESLAPVRDFLRQVAGKN